MRVSLSAVAVLLALVAAMPPRTDDPADCRSGTASACREQAEHGDAAAQFRLGVAYADGLGVARDAAKAAQWYRRAADQGVALAQFSLGVMYQQGDGVPRDPAAAARWYRRAADQDFAFAQLGLGSAYETGSGVARDDVQAYLWFSLAARHYPWAGEARDRVAAGMTPARIRQAQALADARVPAPST
jgi:TPR repeat protein